MKPLKFKVEIALFWMPLLCSFILNPGRNGSNISTFSHAELWALLLCGFISVVFILVQFLQPKQLINHHETITTWAWLKYVLFALFIACYDLGYSTSTLLAN
jgi:hypothetical protein